MPEMADAYEVVPRGGGYEVTIDGVEVPWYIATEGLRIEQPDPDVPIHLIWLPILVRGDMPNRRGGKRADGIARA